jgi:hypothetical protein
MKNFSVYNMPGMLDRIVTKPDPSNPANRIRDYEWHETLRRRMAALFLFFEKNGLLIPTVVLPDVSEVVLRFDDFSELGKKFIMSQAPDKWLGTFDRPGSKKKDSDVGYLQKRLEKLKLES